MLLRKYISTEATAESLHGFDQLRGDHGGLHPFEVSNVEGSTPYGITARCKT
jgi:hypothetical protein